MRGNQILTFPIRTHQIGWPFFVAVTLAMCVALFLAILLSGDGSKSSATVGLGDPHQASFSDCSGPIRNDCVVDGDTFWFGGRKIRIADINTPELGSASCDYEMRLGMRAKDRLRAILNKGGFSLAANPDGRDQDKYGRDLRIVMRGGVSVGDILVSEGLAEHWQGYRRDWC